MADVMLSKVVEALRSMAQDAGLEEDPENARNYVRGRLRGLADGLEMALELPEEPVCGQPEGQATEDSDYLYQLAQGPPMDAEGNLRPMLSRADFDRVYSVLSKVRS